MSGFAAASAEDAASPVLVEVFLSQSCKASPPAAELVEKLSAREDLVALAWHVGYWDWLAGSEGETWADPYSQPVFAERHRLYNLKLRGKPRGMTPQAVVDGAATVSAAHAEDVLRLIETARAAPRQTPRIDFTERDGGLSVSVAGADGDAVLVRFKDKAVTEIDGGDNAGIIFAEANVVTGVEPLGRVDDAASFAARKPDQGSGCAVLVQEPGQGRVIAARYCP